MASDNREYIQQTVYCCSCNIEMKFRCKSMVEKKHNKMKLQVVVVADSGRLYQDHCSNDVCEYCRHKTTPFSQMSFVCSLYTLLSIIYGNKNSIIISFQKTGGDWLDIVTATATPGHFRPRNMQCIWVCTTFILPKG